MKKFILYSLLTIVTLILAIVALIFFKPGILINPENLRFALQKTHVLKKWSWKNAEMVWGYKAWDQRTFRGRFENFCFDYEADAMKISSCLEEVSWDVENLKLTVKTLKPFVIHSESTKVEIFKPKEEQKKSPVEVWKYWTMLWSSLTPDMDIWFKELKVATGGKEYDLDFKLVKSAKVLKASSHGIHAWANPESIEIRGPSKIALPKKIEGMEPLFLHDLKLVARMKEEGIPLELTATLASALIKVKAYLDLPIQEDLASVAFRKKFILTANAKIKVPGIKRAFSQYAPDPFEEFPAPLNVMDGIINIDFTTKDLPEKNQVLVLCQIHTNLQSPKQVLNFDLASEAPVNLETYKPESLQIGLDFHQVQLQLPRLSKKSPPPQFLPDSRFKNAPFRRAESKKTKPLDLTVHLQALNEKAMSFRTNLLDEILKLNFDLNIHRGNLREGFIDVLPLRTTVFKRPLQIRKFKVTFHQPVEPVVEAEIHFPLPEYQITLKLQGPLSKPRYAFTSVPPLPQSDIYAVLLFGRPMSSLDSGDKTSAQKTNQILSQGILSLSVLYFLAGSPVEYVGYDPGSKNATAQFGLGNKTSLRVGGGQEGINSSAIRRSLGKGWYLDTSVQSSSDVSSSSTRNYGVLLERIITY